MACEMLGFPLKVQRAHVCQRYEECTGETDTSISNQGLASLVCTNLKAERHTEVGFLLAMQMVQGVGL